MTADPFPTPTRREPRGEFPDHPPPPADYRLLTRQQALDLARANLAAWVKAHREDADDDVV